MARGNDPTKLDHPASPREGVVTGLIGAAIVAIFYLVFDLVVRGQALLTPSILGQVLVLRESTPIVDAPVMSAVAIYTVAHLIAFTAFGLFLTGMVRRSESSTLARYGVVQLLVAFVVFFYGVLSVASEITRGMFPLWSVLAANFLAAGAMGYYLWRRHPLLRHEMERTPLGAADVLHGR